MDQYHSRWRRHKPRPTKRSKAIKAARARSKINAEEPRPPTGRRPRPNPQPIAAPARGPSEPENKSDEESRPSSRSSRKSNLFGTSSKNQAVKDVSQEKSHYFLVHREALTDLGSSLLCSLCKSKSIKMKFEESHGFCKKIITYCEACEEEYNQTYTSPRIPDLQSSRAPFEINRLMVEAFNNIGAGYADMERFCMVIGLDKMAQKTWENHLNSLLKANSSQMQP